VEILRGSLKQLGIIFGMVEFIQNFLIFGCLGLSLEILFTSILTKDPTLQGHTNLWIFPVYGFGAGILFPLLQSGLGDAHWGLRYALYGVVGQSIQYFYGLLLHKGLKIRPWDHTGDSWTSIQGYIRVDYLPLFFLFGASLEYMHPFLAL
jgi:uncharacterized membrane protein